MFGIEGLGERIATLQSLYNVLQKTQTFDYQTTLARCERLESQIASLADVLGYERATPANKIWAKKGSK